MQMIIPVSKNNQGPLLAGGKECYPRKKEAFRSFGGQSHPQVVITKLKLDKDRKALLERRSHTAGAEKGKGLLTASEKEAMENID